MCDDAIKIIWDVHVFLLFFLCIYTTSKLSKTLQMSDEEEWRSDHCGTYKVHDKKLLDKYLNSRKAFDNFLGYHSTQLYIKNKEKLMFVPPFRLNVIQTFALDSIISIFNNFKQHVTLPFYLWRKMLYDAMFYAFYKVKSCPFFSLKNEKCPAVCKTKIDIEKRVMAILSKKLVDIRRVAFSLKQEKLSMNGLISKKEVAIMIGSMCAYVTYRIYEMRAELQVLDLPLDVEDKIMDEVYHPSNTKFYRVYMDTICDLVIKN